MFEFVADESLGEREEIFDRFSGISQCEFVNLNRKQRLGAV